MILKEYIQFSQSGKKNGVSDKENGIMSICLEISECLTIRDGRS